MVSGNTINEGRIMRAKITVPGDTLSLSLSPSRWKFHRNLTQATTRGIINKPSTMNARLFTLQVSLYDTTAPSCLGWLSCLTYGFRQTRRLILAGKQETPVHCFANDPMVVDRRLRSLRRELTKRGMRARACAGLISGAVNSNSSVRQVQLNWGSALIRGQ